jgi:hypothetical protein
MTQRPAIKQSPGIPNARIVNMSFSFDSRAKALKLRKKPAGEGVVPAQPSPAGHGGAA